MSYLWALRPYFHGVWVRLLLGAIGGIAMNTAVVLPAILLGRALDAALALERGETSREAVTWAALAFVGGTLATELPRVLKRWCLQTANSRIRAAIRADAFRGVIGWPMDRLQQTSVGDVMGRIVSDVEVVGVGVREFTTETWDTVLFSLSLVVAMLAYDAGLTAAALLPVPAAMLLAQASGRWVTARTVDTRRANADLTASIQQHLAGIRVLRLFGRSDAAVERVAARSERQAEVNLRLERLRAGLLPVYSTLMMAGLLVVVWQGGGRVVSGAWTVGAFVAYLQLFLRFVNRGYRVPQLVNSIQSGAAAWERVRPLLASRVDSDRRGVVSPRTSGPVALSLQQVTFRYPGAAEPALRDVSLEIAPGALVAVTGPIGSGKSSLVRALLGVHELEVGRVLLDGRPVGELHPEERARLIGYLPQHAELFSGSIRENVLFGAARDGEESLRRAVALAALDQDLASMPDGLDAQVGELGTRISGGQGVRVALARALAAASPGTPGLLVLDDPFSAVDVHTEARIVEGLRNAFGPGAPPERRATIVLCSHRLAAFPQADCVVVLRDGAVLEQGTHAELMTADGAYARIYRAQRWEERPRSIEASTLGSAEMGA